MFIHDNDIQVQDHASCQLQRLNHMSLTHVMGNTPNVRCEGLSPDNTCIVLQQLNSALISRPPSRPGTNAAIQHAG